MNENGEKNQRYHRTETEPEILPETPLYPCQA